MATAGLKGMDVDQATTLVKMCKQDSETISAIAQKLGGQIQNTPWYGTDADSFRHAWEGEYRRDLRTVSTALHEISIHLNKEIQQQMQASGN